MPNRLGGRPHLDLDVITKTIQALHQLALGEVGAVAFRDLNQLNLKTSRAWRIKETFIQFWAYRWRE